MFFAIYGILFNSAELFEQIDNTASTESQMWNQDSVKAFLILEKTFLSVFTVYGHGAILIEPFEQFFNPSITEGSTWNSKKIF